MNKQSFAHMLFIFELQLTRPAHSLLGISVSCSEGGKDDRAEPTTAARQEIKLNKPLAVHVIIPEQM